MKRRRTEPVKSEERGEESGPRTRAAQESRGGWLRALVDGAPGLDEGQRVRGGGRTLICIVRERGHG